MLERFADLHPVFSHFPIALLLVSVMLDLLARRWPSLGQTAWITLLIGTLGTLPSIVSGVIAHFPYESAGGALLGHIERHQFLAFAAGTIFIGLSIWRWRGLRRGSDVSHSWLYALVSIVGAAVLLLVGMTGGDLVYDYGVGVEHIAP